jgi:hypothetical protein
MVVGSEYMVRVRVMVFNATFNNISVILAEETLENHRNVASHWQIGYGSSDICITADNGYLLIVTSGHKTFA